MSDRPPRLILIADREKEAASQLGEALKKKGYAVIYTYDGSNSIEVVITHLPDLVFYDSALPLIHYKKFIQIIRSNPRTMHIPVIVVGRATEKIGFSTLTESRVNKPYDINAVVTMVENIFHKIDTADMLKTSNKAFEGKLSEISLPDLIQVFAINRKSGVLNIKGERLSGNIYLRNGEIIHASTGKVYGEKAFFRLLGVNEGDFVFQPDVLSEQISIRSSLDNLIMEGMRQLDETRRLISEGLKEDAYYVVVESKRQELSGLHPIAEDVISELKNPRQLNSLLDALPYYDLEIMTTLKSLIGSGVVEILKPEEIEKNREATTEEYTSILSDEEWKALSFYINENLCKRYSFTTALICIVCPNKILLKKFIRVLKKVNEIDLLDYNQVVQAGFGRLGILKGKDLAVDIYLPPAHRQFGPFRKFVELRSIGSIQITSSAAQSIAINTPIEQVRTDPYGNYIPLMKVVVPNEEVTGIKELSFVEVSIEIGEKKEPPTRYDLSTTDEVVLMIRRFISSIIKNSIAGY